MIEEQGRQFGELERTVVGLREQFQALHDTNLELEQRANRSVSQVILAQLRRKRGHASATRPAVGPATRLEVNRASYCGTGHFR